MGSQDGLCRQVRVSFMRVSCPGLFSWAPPPKLSCSCCHQVCHWQIWPGQWQAVFSLMVHCENLGFHHGWWCLWWVRNLTDTQKPVLMNQHSIHVTKCKQNSLAQASWSLLQRRQARLKRTVSKWEGARHTKEAKSECQQLGPWYFLSSDSYRSSCWDSFFCAFPWMRDTYPGTSTSGTRNHNWRHLSSYP